MQSADDVISRMRGALKLGNDSELADWLQTGKSTVASWRGRNSVPIEHVARVAEVSGATLDWLLLGRPQGDKVADVRQEYAPREPQSSGRDLRMEAIVGWLERWWQDASDEERTWAVVQLRRAFPEFAEWCWRRNGSSIYRGE